MHYVLYVCKHKERERVKHTIIKNAQKLDIKFITHILIRQIGDLGCIYTNPFILNGHNVSLSFFCVYTNTRNFTMYTWRHGTSHVVCLVVLATRTCRTYAICKCKVAAVTVKKWDHMTSCYKSQVTSHNVVCLVVLATYVPHICDMQVQSSGCNS